MNLRALLVLSALSLSFAPWQSAVAQDPPARTGKKAPKKRAERPRPEKKQTVSKKPESKASPARESQAAPIARESEAMKTRAQEAARAAAQDSSTDAHIVKEGDTNVKVMTFSGLDIEGRLKSPQLLYFVHRVQTEFERPKLPHRSFMPELNRTTQREPVR